ncbi:FG-GAP-like repeat-containing protein [Hoeflea sp.]|uniref:FG-GAP-like repeat-containing protein n=1 Tax=Hoeflea sp. TaxID=1940281 RepID=UPI003BAF7A0D
MAKTYDFSSLYEINSNNQQSFDPGFEFQVVWFSAADLDGDGYDEFILGGHNSGADSARPAAIFDIDANLQLSVATSLLAPSSAAATVWPRWILTGDFNGDGDLDVFFAAHGYDYSPFPGEPNLLLLSDGAGGLAPAPVPFEQFEFSHTAAAGDIDGDGDLDIYVGNVASQNVAPYLMINDGTGSFTLDRSRLPASMTASDGRDPWNAAWYDSVYFADVNGDNKLDMIVGKFGETANGQTHSSYVYFNDGNGFYSDASRNALPQPGQFGTASTSYDLELMDIDGDGDLDIFNVYTDSANAQGWEIQLLINDGQGNFTDGTAQHFRTGETSQANIGYFLSFLDIADVNNDGFGDLIARYLGSGQADSAPAIWLNDGTGHFAAITNLELFPDNYSWLAGRQYQPVVTPNGIEFVVPFDLNGNFLNDPLTLTARVSTGPGGLNPAAQGAAGFNELFYLNSNADVTSLVGAGTYATGLAHYLAVGAGEGRLGMAAGARVDGTEGVDNYTAANGQGVYHLLGGDDVFNGSSGNETVHGGEGADTLNGGGGDDNLYGGIGADAMDGGTGTDYARYDDATSAVAVYLANDRPNSGEAAGDTFANIEGLILSAHNDYGFGDDGANYIYGQGGSDSLAGGLGADYLDGGEGFDYVRYDDAAYPDDIRVYLQSQYSNLNTGVAAIGDIFVSIEGLQTSVRNDTLFGNSENNILLGNLGTDNLYGFTGNDTLYGGAGDPNGDGVRDNFVFDQAPIAANADIVGDFERGLDQIALSTDIFGTDESRIQLNPNTSELVYTGVNGNEYNVIATLIGETVFDASDFYFY